MTDVRSRYDEHLGPIYEWMAGFEAACAPNTQVFEELGLQPSGGVAVDLGCGHGLQAFWRNAVFGSARSIFAPNCSIASSRAQIHFQSKRET